MELTDYETWAQNEWGRVAFGDERLNSRAVSIGAAFYRSPFVSPPQMLKSLKKIKAFYRFMDSNKVSHEGLITHHTRESRERISAYPLVLAVEDSTTINLERAYVVEGGYDIGNVQGVVVHNTISVIPLNDYGIVDGLLHQTIVRRTEKSQRDPEYNETRTWKESIDAVKKPKNTIIVDVMDRGADALEVMHCSKKNNHEFIIRAKQNRYIKDDKHDHLFDFTKALTPQGSFNLDLKTPRDRRATLHVAYANVTLDTPKNKHTIPPLNATIIHVYEHEPQEKEPIEWYLLTSLTIKSLNDARQIIRYYSYRWTIEEYHKCLKTGFRLEKTQLHTLKRIENLLGFISVSAIKLLQIRDIIRRNPNANALEYVTKEDTEIIQAYYHTKEKTITIDKFLRHIAQMGGFLNRKSDGNPGWESIWNGWKFFMTLKEGVHLRMKRCG